MAMTFERGAVAESSKAQLFVRETMNGNQKASTPRVGRFSKKERLWSALVDQLAEHQIKDSVEPGSNPDPMFKNQTDI